MHRCRKPRIDPATRTGPGPTPEPSGPARRIPVPECHKHTSQPPDPAVAARDLRQRTGVTRGDQQTSIAPPKSPARRGRQLDKAAFALLDSLFRRPKFLYIAVGPDIPADIQPIIARMNNALAANQAWFQQYRGKYPNRIRRRYDPLRRSRKRRT